MLEMCLASEPCLSEWRSSFQGCSAMRLQVQNHCSYPQRFSQVYFTLFCHHCQWIQLESDVENRTSRLSNFTMLCQSLKMELVICSTNGNLLFGIYFQKRRDFPMCVFALNQTKLWVIIFIIIKQCPMGIPRIRMYRQNRILIGNRILL